MSVTALQAAKRACQTSRWTLSNLQLQKILYIAHMAYAGAANVKLIDPEAFEAWRYGPVLPRLYRWTKWFGAGPIPPGLFGRVRDIDGGSAEARVIDTAVNTFGVDPAWKLVQIVHDDKSAWSRLYDPSARHTPINQEAVTAESERRFGTTRTVV